MMVLTNAVFLIGIILLLHSAYSCMHYRSLLQVIDETVSGTSADVLLDAKPTPATSIIGVDGSTTTTATRSSKNGVKSSGIKNISVPPLDVYIESIIAFLLILIAELIRPGSTLLPVVSNSSSTNSKPKQLIAPPYITRDFDIYTTRARGLYLSTKTKLS